MNYLKDVTIPRIMLLPTFDSKKSNLTSEKRLKHELQTPNEGIHQRNLKIWADVADKICFSHT